MSSRTTKVKLCRSCGIEFDTKKEQLIHMNNHHRIKSPRGKQN